MSKSICSALYALLLSIKCFFRIRNKCAKNLIVDYMFICSKNIFIYNAINNVQRVENADGADVSHQPWADCCCSR